MLLVVLAAHWIVVIAVVAVVWGHGLAKRRMVMRQKFERSSSVEIPIQDATSGDEMTRHGIMGEA